MRFDLRQEIDNAALELQRSGAVWHCIDDRMTAIFTIMWKTLPNSIHVTNYSAYMRPQNVSDNDENERHKDILIPDTLLNVRKYCSKKKYPLDFVELRYHEYPIFVIENKTIIVVSYEGIVFLTTENELPKWFTNCIVYSGNNKLSYHYMIFGKDGFDTIELKIKNEDIDIAANYNDDLPDQQILDFLNGPESGLVLLYGTPGTGKSTYIKHLITNVDKDFIYMDQSCFDNIMDASFVEEMLDFKDSVIILEDCEELLNKRDSSSSSISALLNLTDGIIGDCFHLKIICTFNADITNIDPALRRKGRMRIEYKFRPLTKQKADALNAMLGMDVLSSSNTLADIYHAKHQYTSKKTHKKIGF